MIVKEMDAAGKRPELLCHKKHKSSMAELIHGQ